MSHSRLSVGEHTVLTKLKVNSKVWDEQVAWVRGYILALEDVLGDLETLLQSMQYGYSFFDARTALEAAVEQVTETWTQARATLKTLERMQEEAGDLQPTQASADQAEAS